MKKATLEVAFFMFVPRSGQHHFQHPDHLRLRVMPPHLHIPELHPIHPLGRWYLIGRSRVLGQALLDQLYQWLSQA